jgi:hypothetical protein
LPAASLIFLSVFYRCPPSQQSLHDVAQLNRLRSLAALERYLDQDAARVKAEGARSLLVG